MEVSVRLPEGGMEVSVRLPNNQVLLHKNGKNDHKMRD